jgi:hypothetical protein
MQISTGFQPEFTAAQETFALSISVIIYDHAGMMEKFEENEG